MTRELKLALIVGFSVVLVVTVLIADHLSPGSQSRLAMDLPVEPPRVVENPDVAIVDAPKAERVSSLNGGADTFETGSFTSGPADRFDTPVFGPNGGSANREPGTVITQGANGGVQKAGGAPESGRMADTFRPLQDEIERLGGQIEDGVVSLPPAARVTQQPTGSLNSGGSSEVPQANLPKAPDTVEPATPGKPQPARVDDLAHTVVAGDSAYKIAQKYYGDASLWPKLAAYNGNRIGENGRLRSGITLRIPTKEVLLGGASADTVAGRVTPVKEAAKPEAKPQPKAPAVRDGKASGTVNYTVKKGDTLREIARRELGSTKRMNEIVELNRKVIRDVNNVPSGVVIKLPAKTV